MKRVQAPLNTIEKLLSMWNSGFTTREICSVLKISREDFLKYVEKLNLVPALGNRRRLTTEDILEIRDMFLSGVHPRIIAEKFKVNTFLVYRYLARMGLPVEKYLDAPAVSREKLVLLFLQGCSDREIAMKLNTTVLAVKILREKYGIYRKYSTELKLNVIIRHILKDIYKWGFTTNRRLSRILGFKVASKHIKMLSDTLSDMGIDWFTINQTSTSGYTVLPLKMLGLIILYQRERETDVAVFILSSILGSPPRRTVTRLIRNWNAPEKILEEVHRNWGSRCRCLEVFDVKKFL